MLLRRFYSDTNLVTLLAPINEEITIRGLAIRISGTAGATAPTVGDIGRIVYQKNGQTYIDAGADALLALGDLIGGTPNRESTNSGVVDFFIYIPRRWNDRNVELILPRDNAIVRSNFNANLATRIASSGLVEVYMDIDEGQHSYDLRINQYSDSLAAAGTRPIAIDHPNIVFIGLSATVGGVFTLTGSNISNISVDIGGKQGDMSLGVLQDNTTFQFNLENLAGTVTLVPYELMGAVYHATGEITSRLNDNFSMRLVTTGACNFEVLVVGASYDANRADATQNTLQQRANVIADSKASRGDGATLQTLEKTKG